MKTAPPMRVVEDTAPLTFDQAVEIAKEVGETIDQPDTPTAPSK